MRTSSIILALSLVSLCLSYPLEADSWDSNPDDLHKRQQRSPEDCADPNQNPSADCWTTLGVDQYLQGWIANNSASCNDGDFSGDGFASCYQQEVGRGELLGLQCDQVQIQSCRPPGNFSSYTPQEYYVLYSIFGIWQYFNSIYFASDFANGIASDRVGAIVSGISPIESNTAASIALSVLTAAFAFLSLPADALVEGTATAVSSTVQSTVVALQQAPGVLKALQQPATVAGLFNEVNAIEATLANLVAKFQANIANALAALQNDGNSVRAFAANGSFMVPQPSLNASTAILTQVLTTYISSQAAQGGATRYEIVFYPGDNSNATGVGHLGNDTYNFIDHSVESSPGTKVMDTILNSGWSTPELLLGGALNCAIATVEANGDPSPTPSIDPNTLTPLCISNLNVLMNAAPASNVIAGCGGSREPSQQCITPHSSFLQDRDKLKGLSQRDYLRQYGDENGSKVVNQYLDSIGK
ncbi:MAG: hypothetical protein OHK93_005989 [Ramalina farinacea]|uniref:Uncharacterized protein n=1 Tax=Ramalina farinacea TaxID=258253 RepID=A0AA43QL58_9LECA|nr:hypothetical protein [Ramalina farinacea]